MEISQKWNDKKAYVFYCVTVNTDTARWYFRHIATVDNIADIKLFFYHLKLFKNSGLL